MKLFKQFIFLFFLLILSEAKAATIVNHSFEDGGEGTVPGWTGDSIWAATTVVGFDGARYMYLAQAGHTLSQTIAIDPNKRYRLIFLAAVGSAGFEGQNVSITYNTGTTASVNIVNNGYAVGFDEYTLTLEPEAGTTSLTIRGETVNGEFLKMDYFRLEEETPAVSCTLNQPTVSTQCNNSNTPTDPSDDIFTYTINTTGTGVGTSYNISGGDTQNNVAYNTNFTSPTSFPISGGNLTLVLTDGTTASCTLNNITVTAPTTCSNATPQIDLQVSKTVSPSSVNSGEQATYTITVVNNGADNATNVQVTEQLPNGLSYVSDNPSQGTYDNNTGVWTVGDLANGANATLTINVSVD